MVSADLHPARGDLEAFALGRLADDAHAVVEQHVVGCSDCQQALEQIPGDALVALLRSAGSVSETVKAADAEGTLADRPGPASVAGDSQTRAWEPAGKARPPELPAALAGHPRYQATRLLGHGGMGAVWLAEHRLMRRQVAVKVVRLEHAANPEAVERFRREVHAAARLQHANIVTAFDAEQIGDVHLLAMEYIEGVNLADHLRQHGPLPITLACDAVLQAALGLQHASDRGLIHRDLKPYNLMRTPDGTVKILDFGLAVLADAGRGPDGLTGQNVVLGTPDYIAPEQAEDARTADVRSDIYSLGCTLYHLLTGRVPFPGNSVLRKLDGHRHSTPEPLRNLRPDVPEGLAAVVATMMARQPADRYQAPVAVVAALAPWCGPVSPKPVVAASTALGETGPHPKRRRPWWGWAAALVATVLVAAGVVYRIQTDRGDVVITPHSPDVEIALLKDGKEVRVIDTKTDRRVTVPTGTYDVVAKNKPEGIKVKTNRIVILRGEEALVTIESVPRAKPARPVPDQTGKVQPVPEQQSKIELVRSFPVEYASRDFLYYTAVSKGGKYALVTRDVGHGVRLDLFEPATGTKLVECWGYQAEFLGDGEQLVVAIDGLYRVLESRSGKVLREGKPTEPEHYGMMIAPGEKHMVYRNSKGYGLFDLTAMKELWFRQARAAGGLLFSADGKRLLSRTGEKEPWQAWDIEANREVKGFAGLPNESLIRLLPGGKAVLAVRDGKYVYLDAATGKVVKTLRSVDLGPGGLTSVYGTKGEFLLRADADGSVRLFPLATAQQPWRYELPADDRTLPNQYQVHTTMAVSSDDRYATLVTRRSLSVFRLPPCPRQKTNPDAEGPGMETSVSLLERLTGRPSEADWQQLVALYQPLLRAWALRAGAPEIDADDLVQEVLTVVVDKVGEFRHAGPGAFRSWLRTILVYRLRAFFRGRHSRPVATGDSAFLERLKQLEAPDTELSRLWDREHDRHVAGRVMKLVQRDVEPATWQAFRRHVLDDVPAPEVAAELGLSRNAVLLAKSRVLKRLRAELAGLVDC